MFTGSCRDSQGNILTSMVKVNVLEEIFIGNKKIPIKITTIFQVAIDSQGIPVNVTFVV